MLEKKTGNISHLIPFIIKMIYRKGDNSSFHTWLAEIIIDSALEKADSYYAQVFKIVKIHREKSS